MELLQTGQGIELVHQKGNWILKKELGFSPVETLVASVGACGTYVYETILVNSKIEATFQKIEIFYQRDANKKAQPVNEITIEFHLKIAQKNQKRAQRALSLIQKNCPVIQSLDPAIVVKEIVVFI